MNSIESYELSNLDYSSKDFLQDFLSYCVHSIPEDGMESKSLSVRIKFSNIFLQKLKKCDHSLLMKNKQGENIGYAFLKEEHKGEALMIEFIFPSENIKNTTHKEKSTLFTISAIKLMKFFDVSTIKGNITRTNKIKGYITFIKRYIKYVELSETNQNIQATITKDKVLSYYAKL